MTMPIDPNFKHPRIIKKIDRIHRDKKRGYGKAFPVDDVPLNKLMIDKSDEFKQVEKDRYHKPQTADTGVNAYYGKWPGDETEQELLDLMSDDREIARLKSTVGTCYLIIVLAFVALVFMGMLQWA